MDTCKNIIYFFNWFLGDLLFSMKYNIIKICSICFNYENNDEVAPPYISISSKDIISNTNIIDIIYSKFKTIKTACAKCSYEGLGETQNLKIEEKYHTCLTSYYSNLIMPKFMIFSLELSSELEPDNHQFSNLKKYKNQIVDFNEEKFSFINLEYELLGIIFLPLISHYSAYCHYCYIEKLNLQLGKSYYYDDLVNKGKIELINESNFRNKIAFISKYNPFVLIYGTLN